MVWRDDRTTDEKKEGMLAGREMFWCAEDVMQESQNFRLAVYHVLTREGKGFKAVVEDLKSEGLSFGSVLLGCDGETFDESFKEGVSLLEERAKERKQEDAACFPVLSGVLVLE